jgi:hypothetical protein
MGIVEKGYNLTFSYGKEMITDTDQFGAMVIDAVYRGIANCFLQTTLYEYLNTTLMMLTPYGAAQFPGPSTIGGAGGAGTLTPGVVGLLDSYVGGAAVLTSTAGTPAAASPASVTIASLVIAENFDTNMLFGPYLRKLPIRFRIYPTVVSTVVRYLSCT